MQEYKVEDIKRIIKVGLENYVVLFRAALRNSEFKKLNTSQRANAARALVNLSDVANNPDKYFSREQTCAAWSKRISDRIVNNGENKSLAKHKAMKPDDIVMAMLNDLPEYVKSSMLMHEFRDFTAWVRRWEYAHAMKYGMTARENAEKIIKDADRVVLATSVVHSTMLMRPLHKLLYSLQYS